jgi:uncharacterized membrane protein HdeD (DUF308 family)
MPDVHELLTTAALPIVITGLASAAQNFAQKDNAWKSLLGGLVGGIVTVLFTYLSKSWFGGS